MLAGIGIEARPSGLQALPGTVHQLAAVGLAVADQVGDLAVIVVEGFLQQEGGAFLGAELFEQGQEGDRDVVGQRMQLGRAGRRVGLQGDRQRLGQPRADVVHALALGCAQPVQAKPGGGGDQPGLGIADAGLIGAGPAQPGVLDHVFGVGAAAEQAVGQGHQARAVGLECGFRVHVDQDAGKGARVTGSVGSEPLAGDPTPRL